MRKLALLLLLVPALAFGQKISNLPAAQPLTGTELVPLVQNGLTVETAASNLVVYPRTAAEIAAGVTPVSYGYQPWYVVRYGADPTGIADSSAAFTACASIGTNPRCVIPPGTYLLNSSPTASQFVVWDKQGNVTFTGAGSLPTGTLTVSTSSNPVVRWLAQATLGSQQEGFNLEQELNHPGTASWDDFGQTTEVFTPTSDTQNFTGQETSVYGSFNHFGSGTLGLGIGASFEAYNGGASTGGNLIGLHVDAQNGGVAAGIPLQTPSNNGTLASEKGVYTYVGNMSSGNVTFAEGVYIDTPSVTGTGAITNDYGLFINPQNKGTSSNYAIYTNAGLVHFGDVMQLAPYTVSTLPTCNSANKGGMAYVTDATSPAYNGALTGGGAVIVPVFCNGTSWTSH